jgi:transcription factor TFIIIB component B''
VAAVGTVAQENLSTPPVHTPGPPAITSNSTSSTAAASIGALQANVNPPATKRRRVEQPQTKNSSTQSSTPKASANVPRSTTETDAVVSEPSITAGRGYFSSRSRSKPDKAKKPTKPKVSAKARGKQRADVATAPNDADATQITSGPANAASQPPKAKRPRKPAKGKGRQTAEEAAAEVVADATQGTAGKKRNVRSRRKRSPTPEEAATETIIASEVKMVDLCKDMRKGKKSKRERELQIMEEAEIAKKRQKELHDLLAAEEPEAPDSNPQETTDERLERLATAGTRAQPETILVDGEITIDYNTMQIDRHANAAVERRAEQQESVEETDLSRRVNAGSYMKVERSGSWNEDETTKFYDGLGMFGTDFEMISKLFPGRSRRSIKLKFCKEEKADYQRIKETLMGERIPVDIDEFSRATNTVFDDPKELEREIEEDRRALEQDMAAEKEVMQEAVRKRAEEARIEGEAVEGEGGAKENVGKAKKGKREKAERKQKGKRGKAPHAGGEEVVLGTIEEGAVQGQVEVEVGA